MQKILIVEDETEIAALLYENLKEKNYVPVIASTLAQARETITTHLDISLVLLDMNLPDGLSLSLCEELRKNKFTKPIIFLTAQLSEEFVLKAFEAGATDYVKKPFSMDELEARIGAHLRNSNPPSATEENEKKMISFKGLSIYPEMRICEYKGKDIRLNQRQLSILIYLITNNGKVVSRKDIAKHLELEEKTSDRTIDAHLSQLRKKLIETKIKKLSIQSIYGIGYRLS